MTGGGNDQKLQSSERIERWRDFQAQLLQCWVGEAIARVVQRAVSSIGNSSNDVKSIALVSLLSDEQDEDAAAFANISAFVKQFLKIQHVRHCGEGGVSEDPGTRSHVASVADVDEFKQWLQSHHHEQQLLSQDRQQPDVTCLVILYAPLLSVEKQDEIAQIVVASGNTRMTRTLLLVINDPIGLMGVECDSSSSSTCYNFVDSQAATNGDELSLRLQSTERFLVRPLKQLGSQCGLRFVMEIARWTVFKEELSGAGSVDGATSSIAGPRPPAMLASVSQMPFQLLLLALRWSHFHPTLVRAFAKPFERKLGLIPQHRIREAICQLRDQEMALWSHLESAFEDPRDQVLTLPHRRRLSADSEIAIPLGQDVNKLKKSLFECQLWDVQKQFYLAQGIRAWSDGIIPFGVSSSSFLAAAYARVAVDFFLETAGPNDNFDTGDAPSCFVWEAASGSCKFLHAFLVHFYQLIEEDQAAHEFVRRGLRPCVVASDLSDQVLKSRMEMACFQPFLQDQRLEFARFDTAAFTQGDAKKQLFLKHSKKIWHVGRDGPVFLMGNYFLDSLRADVFAVTKSTVTSSSSSPLDDVVVPVEDAQIKVFEGRVDHKTTSIADMELAFQQIDPFAKAIYDDSFVNQVFTDVLESIKSAPASTQPSSLILFPVEAIQFIRTLVDTSSINTTIMERGFPIGIMIGDASFSFRDPIPSAFFNQEDGGGNELLELPQLSPHPDCFCLPVDFEILRLFLQRLASPSSRPATRLITSAQVASAIATDTFDVLYGRVCPPGDKRLDHDHDHEDAVGTTIQPPTSSLRPSTPLSPSQVAFAQEFASFTPSDCDLLWGMMGVDDGAAHFSLKTQIALLAQSAWDFDLFVVLQWKLMRLWQRMLPMAAETTAPTTDSRYHQQMRLQLIAIAKKCWGTFYSLDGDSSKIGEVAQSLSLLQLCRWLYELKAYAEVNSLLSESIERTPKLEANVSICYLLALAYYNSRDLWQALVYFRRCFAIAPTRVKFRRRIAQTLLALQRQKLQERENRYEW